MHPLIASILSVDSSAITPHCLSTPARYCQPVISHGSALEPLVFVCLALVYPSSMSNCLCI